MLQKVIRSTVIDAPIARVWAVLRDFNSHDQWHGAVAESRIEGGEHSDQVGCIRAFTLADGHFIREQLLALDDLAWRSTYCIVEATVPLSRYVATVTLKPVTDGDRTFWHWECSFATPPGREAELRRMVAEGVYEAGFANLLRHLREGGDLRRRRERGAAGAATGSSAGTAAASSADAIPRALPLPSRRIVVRDYGGAEVLRAEAAECEAPAAGEVRLRQRAIGVNFFDVYLRRGWMPALLPLPGTPGLEAAGEVLDAGDGVTAFLPGDRVAYLGPVPGAYASVRSVPAAWCVRLPPALDETTAAAVLLKGLTADMLVNRLARVGPGMRVLVHAAAGGVGGLTCRWARRLGATVIGTVGSEAKARAARDAGCEHVVVNATHRFADAVLGATGGRGVDVVVDGLGAAAREENLKCLARGGHWISLGQATGPLPALSPDELVAKSLTFSRPVVFDHVLDPPGRLAERAAVLWRALEDGTLVVPPIERFTLDAAAAAQARLESRGLVGAAVLLA
jgi:NADPH:quinone reductase-like Zn-dependent oxidoreductase/uncharacterized protein YndB with AHSA1/START domain